MFKESISVGSVADVACPTCEGMNTHHSFVETFHRIGGEDGQSYKMFIGDMDKYATTENPSKRRDAIRIHFDCESGHAFYMDVIQHKGMTHIDFSPNGDSERFVYGIDGMTTTE